MNAIIVDNRTNRQATEISNPDRDVANAVFTHMDGLQFMEYDVIQVAQDMMTKTLVFQRDNENLIHVRLYQGENAEGAYVADADGEKAVEIFSFQRIPDDNVTSYSVSKEKDSTFSLADLKRIIALNDRQASQEVQEPVLDLSYLDSSDQE